MCRRKVGDVTTGDLAISEDATTTRFRRMPLATASLLPLIIFFFFFLAPTSLSLISFPFSLSCKISVSLYRYLILEYPQIFGYWPISPSLTPEISIFLDSIEVALFLVTARESQEDNEDIVTIECITIACAILSPFLRRTMLLRRNVVLPVASMQKRLCRTVLRCSNVETAPIFSSLRFLYVRKSVLVTIRDRKRRLQ